MVQGKLCILGKGIMQFPLKGLAFNGAQWPFMQHAGFKSSFGHGSILKQSDRVSSPTREQSAFLFQFLADDITRKTVGTEIRC